ncbi:DNA mismatch repair protein MLH3 [Ziziphus jujuba]|uniref:DNA mismatch repair protein MLH3 n=1 Tax=Ziziphus jujuba TaxID=326968 RepID=A0ABM3ISD0_ZIZJJ|nr:DNA mismatch repair protein MLH3 [Ziziphus jujuba]
MRSIKPLPEAVRSSVRSGIVLFDLTRVVEELIYNCLDAGASKVSVFLGVGTCYVKVVDDGSGITRDGLAFLGERYATSKFDHAHKDAASGSFGFRGEALASLSDVSLLEIVTKAYGKPNGYRKVIKGSKCLYIGIDDERKDVGTTVVVRDLFYNQPVRRKFIQFSPKKVLQSVKKCVLRIALVHSKVSFKVVDIESEDVLLCTHPASPLTLLTSSFGIEVSASLRELNASDGKLKVSGYVSGPSVDDPTIKVFQYVYINSQFVCKGPIHKLLNQLATRFECSDQVRAVSRSQNKKRSRSQAYPAFILNICCPRSFYDLTFEPSKTYVEFKDWVPVLSFINETIQNFWKEKRSYGASVCHAGDIVGVDQMWNRGDTSVPAAKDLLDEDFLGNSTSGRKKFKIQNHQASFDLLSSCSKIHTKEDNCLSCKDHELISMQCSNNNANDFKEHEIEMDYVEHSDYSFEAWDGSLAKFMPKVSGKRENKPCISKNHFSLAEDYFLQNRVTAAERSSINLKDSDVGFLSGDEFELGPSVSTGSARSAVPCDSPEVSNDLEMSRVMMKPFLKSCSTNRSLPLGRELFMDNELDFQSDCFRNKGTLSASSYRYDIPKIDFSNQFDMSRTLWQDQASAFQPFPRVMTKSDSYAQFDCLSRASVKSTPFYEEHLDEENGFSSYSGTDTGRIGSGHQTIHSKSCFVASDSSSQATPWDVENCPDIDTLEERSRSVIRAGNKNFLDSEEKDHRFSHDMKLNSSIQENYTTCWTKSGLDFTTPSRFPQRHNLNIEISPLCTDILTDETHWSNCDSHDGDHTDTGIYKSQRGRLADYQHCERYHSIKERSRSHSAPPFYRSKRRFIALNHPVTKPVTKETEESKMKHPHHSSDTFHQNLKQSAVEDLFLDTSHCRLASRPDENNVRDLEEDIKNVHKDEKLEQSLHVKITNTDPVEEIVSTEFQDSLDSWTKWGKRYPQIASNNKLHDVRNQSDILDISSGFLHLATDSLVPNSINKHFLENAKVLQQVDKKFIPIVAGKTLAVIDQHAADERIRLEELRQKVLSGEARTIMYLDAEQELMLPEIGYQLLHNYAESVKDWGWICNIHAQDSRSFKRNLNILHGKPTTVTLLAVPCILGVKLSDVDLMEFLQQLSDTDGSSIMPPSVLRILNSKACRGAIMFGDLLLPSECSLIVEELKKTSLCFQCAHGRPTTAPIVNLEALHKHIAKIALSNEALNEMWHGLRRHELSLDRAAHRLSSATN